MPSKLNLKDILAQLHTLSADELSTLAQAATGAAMSARGDATRKSTSETLTDFDSHMQLLTDLMGEGGWDDDKEQALIDSLHSKMADNVKGNPGAMSQGDDMIEQIISDAGLASNLLDEMQGMSDEDDEYMEADNDRDAAWDGATTGLEEFWAKYVGK